MNGYIPHDRQGTFRCSGCGNDRFISRPQGIPGNWDVWTFEFNCTKCGKMMGLTQVRR